MRDPDTNALIQQVGWSQVKDGQTYTFSWSTIKAVLCSYGWRCHCWSPQHAVIHGDPHARGADGDTFSLRGHEHGVYNLLSAPNVSFHGQVEGQTFRTSWSRLTVNGTFFRNAYWVLRSPQTGRLLRIAYNARHRMATAEGLEEPIVYDNGPPFLFEGINISMHKGTMAVRTPRWLMTAQSTRRYPHYHVVRMNLRVVSMYDVCTDRIAPHGLLGQTFDCDGLAAHGRKDSYDTLDDGRPTRARHNADPATDVVSTRAQAEGALEGSGEEAYRLASPMQTHFAFSRFDATAPAPPRNASQLGGRVERATRRTRLSSGGAPLPAHSFLGAGSGRLRACEPFQASPCQLEAAQEVGVPPTADP